MSTKTSLLKRVAQTAVVALLGGLLGTVATPAANAASNPNATISATCVMRSTVGGFIKVTMGGYATGTAVVRAIPTEFTAGGSVNNTASTGLPAANLVINQGTLYTGVLTDSQTSSTIVIPIPGDSTTAATSQIKWLVWLDVNGNESTTATMTAASPSTAVTCNDGGAVASFSLSATSASAVAGDTVTFTVTPRGTTYETILQPRSETFTAVVTPGAGRSAIMAGKYIAGTSPTAVIGGFGLGQDTGTTKVQFSDASPHYTVAIASTAAALMPASRNTLATAPTLSHSILLNGNMSDGLPTQRLGLNGLTRTESATSNTYTLNVKAESNTTTTVVVKGTSGIPESVSSTFTLTTAAATYGTAYGLGSAASLITPGYGLVKSGTGWSDGTAATIGLTNPSPVGTTNAATADATILVSPARTTIPLTVQLSQAGTLNYTVAAVTGYTVPSGITAGSYTWTSPSTETQASITFSPTSLVDGQRFKVSWASAANTTLTVTFAVSASKVGDTTLAANLVTLRDTASSKKYFAGSTQTAVATVRDQYGSLVSGATVTFGVSGRNIVANTNVTSGANGTASFSYTDASTSTTSLTDTLSVSATFGNSGSFASTSTTYTASTTALTASAVTVTSDAASTGVSANGAVTLTITVTDASGAVSGWPVTITTDSKSFATATGGLTSNAYTSSTGVATATVYAKTLGSSTVTVSSGGKSATLTYTVIAGAHRTITLDASTVSMTPEAAKNVVATVKDSFGNVDEGVAVTVAYVGTAGRVASINGVSSSTCTTDADGKCTIQLVSEVAGTGTLTVTMTGGDSALTVLNDGSARPTRVATASATVTITGSSATVTAVTAAQAAADAATDAALQAIDAANAATDAANLAAEAADAATVAAQEAKDSADAATAAVESLATQVATLMAALQAQVTSLANVVAKIAKKVKA